MSHNTDDVQFAELMQSEHEHLRRSIQEASDVLKSPHRQRKHLNDLLAMLSEQVESHFRHEEHGGYLTDALARAPHLRSRAEVLQEEHLTLQEQIDKLHLLVHSGVESPSWWTRVESDFHVFAARLHDHEHAETQLVQEAFNQDIGTGD